MPETPDLRTLADEDLMQLMRRGDPRAFEAVYERHSGAAFSLAYRMVGRGNVAEDVVQEAFLSIWRSGARYERARGSRAPPAARCARGGWASSTPVRSTSSAARRSMTSAAPATRGSRSAWNRA